MAIFSRETESVGQEDGDGRAVRLAFIGKCHFPLLDARVTPDFINFSW